MQKIGDRIGTLLKEKGYTQKSLAKQVGVTEAAMSRYLSNQREPKLDVVASFAKALNTTTDYLIYGDVKFESFDEIYWFVARNVHKMEQSEKMKLVQVIVKE